MKQVAVRLLTGVIVLLFFPQMTPAEAAKEKVVYSFCNVAQCTDGRVPEAGLVDVKGTLYGTTVEGGTKCYYGNDCGAVFALDLKTHAEKWLYFFGGGTTDGRLPLAGLIEINGLLYGTTSRGGAYDLGVVFAVNRRTGAEKVLYSFAGGTTDGAYPVASLINVKGTLYDTTEYGGSGGCTSAFLSGCGVVFSIDPKTGPETVLHYFQNNNGDGTWPLANLIDVGGTLYGTTAAGGAGGCNAYGCGTLFSVNPVNGDEAIVHSFGSGKDGNSAFPYAGLIHVKGRLYGTTYGFNSSEYGTVFSFDLKTRKEKLIYTFQDSGADGAHPLAGLTELNGTLYGTTWQGGTWNVGTVFGIDPSTGMETVEYSFQDNGIDAESPLAGMIAVKGVLYGTTSSGGNPYGDGTVFKITP